jgi:hypothetical protein
LRVTKEKGTGVFGKNGIERGKDCRWNKKKGGRGYGQNNSLPLSNRTEEGG